MRRFIACVILPAHLTACMVWRAQEATPQQLLAGEQAPDRVRVTLSGGSWVILREPTISGDSVLGIVEEGSYLGQPLTGGRRTGIPLDDVVHLAILRRFFHGTVDIERVSPHIYPPVAPQDVTVFLSPSELCADTIQYEEIASIVTDGSSERSSHLERAVDEAAKLGANGIIIQVRGKPRWDWWLLAFSWQQTVLAIRWAIIPPEMRRPAS